MTLPLAINITTPCSDTDSSRLKRVELLGETRDPLSKALFRFHEVLKNHAHIKPIENTVHIIERLLLERTL